MEKKLTSHLVRLFLIIFTASLGVWTTNASAESVTAKDNLQKLLKTGSCRECDLSEINFTRMDLSGADLEKADLSLCKFSLANLSRANLRGAKLNGATFGGADLGNADLTGADLRGVIFDGAYLGGTKLDGDFVTVKPYADIGVSDVEKEVYVRAQDTPKKLPETGEVHVEKRRDFEEPPPVIESAPASAFTAIPVVPVAAPEAKKVQPMQIAMVDDEIAASAPISQDAGGVQKVETVAVSKAATAGADVSKQQNNERVEAQSAPFSPDPPKKDSSTDIADLKKDNKSLHSKEISKLLKDNSCYGCDLSGEDLSGKDLEASDLELANLSGSNLSGADLRKANLKGADLSGAVIKGADLRGADLYKADLSGADLTGARIDGAQFDNATMDGVTGLLKNATE